MDKKPMSKGVAYISRDKPAIYWLSLPLQSTNLLPRQAASARAAQDTLGIGLEFSITPPWVWQLSSPLMLG